VYFLVMTSWKSIALILTGILLGCASNAAHTAYADDSASRSSAAKCLGPSASKDGVEDDLNALIAEGYDPFVAIGGVVCGKR
jgi:hypothetical protein